MKRAQWTKEEGERLEKLRIVQLREEYRSTTIGERARAMALSEEVETFTGAVPRPEPDKRT